MNASGTRLGLGVGGHRPPVAGITAPGVAEQATGTCATVELVIGGQNQAPKSHRPIGLIPELSGLSGHWFVMWTCGNQRLPSLPQFQVGSSAANWAAGGTNVLSWMMRGMPKVYTPPGNPGRAAGVLLAVRLLGMGVGGVGVTAGGWGAEETKREVAMMGAWLTAGE